MSRAPLTLILNIEYWLRSCGPAYHYHLGACCVQLKGNKKRRVGWVDDDQWSTLKEIHLRYSKHSCRLPVRISKKALIQLSGRSWQAFWGEICAIVLVKHIGRRSICSDGHVVELTQKRKSNLTVTLDLPHLLRPPYFRREIRKTAILQKRSVLVLSLRGEPCSGLCDKGESNVDDFCYIRIRGSARSIIGCRLFLSKVSCFILILKRN